MKTSCPILGAAIAALLLALAAAVHGRWGYADEAVGISEMGTTAAALYVPAGAVADADEGAAGEP